MKISIKEKIIQNSITATQKKLEKVNQFLAANPLSRIIQIREEALTVLTEHKGEHKKIAEMLGPLAKEEKEQFKIARLQSKPGVTSRKIDEKVELESLLAELQKQLFFEEEKRHIRSINNVQG